MAAADSEEVLRARRVAVAVTAVAAMALLWPVLGAPGTRALGMPTSEGPAHLWGLWTAADGLLSHGPFQRVAAVTAPGGFAADLIDPVSLVAFWPVWLLGGGGPGAAVAAWNALHLVTVLLAGLGGWRLARRVIPEDPAAAVVVVAACAASPYLLGSVGLGRTEYLAGAWYPLHLAWLHAHLSSDRRRADTVGAAVSLGLLAWSGPILAVWVAMVEIPVAWALSRGIVGWRRRARRLAEVAVPAVLLAVPVVWTLVSLDPWWLERVAGTGPSRTVLSLPLQNLVRFLPDAAVGGGLEVAPYPGTAMVLLGLIGLWRRPLAAAPWLALAGALLVASLGREVQIAGESGPSWTGYAPVAYLAAHVPGLGAVYTWARIAALFGAPLGLAAAWAVAETGRRRSQRHLAVAAVAAAVILLDHASWRPVGAVSGFVVTPPADIAAAFDALPDGPIVELPVDNDVTPETAVQEDYSLLWHNGHGRPTSEVPSPHVAAVYGVSGTASAVAVGSRPAEDPCAASEGTRLYAAGFRGVVLQKRRVDADTAARLTGELTALFGEPAHDGEAAASWAVAETEEPSEACMPPLRRPGPRR